jgi:hypothetical protein
MDNNLFRQAFLTYTLRISIALAVFIGIMAVFVLLLYWNAEQLTGWAGGLVFALQTTNEPGITAGIVAVGGMAIGLIALGWLAVGILVGKWEGKNAGMLGCWNAGPGEISFVQTANVPGIAAGVAAIGGAAGYIALGAGGIGRYVLAIGGLGRYLFTLNRRDPEAVELFCRWLPRLREYVHTSPN